MARTLAPSASRYFGRNRAHSSSPSPTQKMASDRMTTFRRSPRKSTKKGSCLLTAWLTHTPLPPWRLAAPLLPSPSDRRSGCLLHLRPDLSGQCLHVLQHVV